MTTPDARSFQKSRLTHADRLLARLGLPATVRNRVRRIIRAMGRGVFGLALAGLFLTLAGCSQSEGSTDQPAAPNSPERHPATASPTAQAISEASPVAPAASAPAAAPHDSPRVVEYAPGIRIDYRIPQVELDGEVILREGPLELLAWSKAPVSKEHESILRLEGKPSRVFEALGLIGLEPGQPARFDYEKKIAYPPTGDPLDVLVRYQSGGRTHTVPACRWMVDDATGKTMADSYWLFTGSKHFDDGRFFADEEGTTITVVDFASAVVSLPESHTESNEALWLGPRTEAIPPIGTPVTVLLQPIVKNREIPRGVPNAPGQGG